MIDQSTVKPDLGHVRPADASRSAQLQKQAREIELDLLKVETERAARERDMAAEPRRRDRQMRQGS